MIIYFDENIPSHLANGFGLIQKFEGLKVNVKAEVKYLPHEHYNGIKDEDWLKLIQTQKSFVITQDVHLTKRKHEMELYRQQKIGLFLLRGTSKKQGMSVWQMVEALAKHWPFILDTIQHKKPPFAFQIKQKGRPKQVQ